MSWDGKLFQNGIWIAIMSFYNSNKLDRIF